MKQRRWWTLIFIFSIFAVIFTVGNNMKGNEKVLKIGILQFAEHEALDAARKGFTDEIDKLGLSIKIDYKNAQGDQSNCTLISNYFVAKNCDLIFAIATPAAQAAAAATSKIPILVTAITNPVDANLVKSNEKPETNVSGTSDLAPISQQVGLIKNLKPEAKNVGILYSLGEANSRFQAEIAFKEIQKLGMEPQKVTFSQAFEIQQVVEYISEKVDAIYTPTDTMVASNMALISKTAMQFDLPVVCGEANLLSKGAAGTFGVDYYELGAITARQAEKILTGKDSPQNMPIEYIKNAELSLNQEVLKKLNLSLKN